MKTITKTAIILLILLLTISCNKDEEIEINITMKPTTVKAGTNVIISGDGFDTNIDKLEVYFNNKKGEITSVTNTEIVAIVPTRAGSGIVKVLNNGTEMFGEEYTYILSTKTRTIAGSARGFADGLSGIAKFDYPSGIAMDSYGDIYVTDLHNHKIRKITANGEVTTFAGSTVGFVDGTGTTAKFNKPYGLTIDSQDNIYVADYENHKIRKITPNGLVTTLAGNGAGFADGVGTDALFYNPVGLTVDTQDNIYVADYQNHKIRKITKNGLVTTFAGSTVGYVDDTGSLAKFYYPSGLDIDRQGNILVVDRYNHKIRKITPQGEVTTIAGSTKGYQDGERLNAKFNFPMRIGIDSNNNIYITDFINHKIRKITPQGEVTTIAGSTRGYQDGTELETKFNYPLGIIIDENNNLYITDQYNCKIRKITHE